MGWKRWVSLFVAVLVLTACGQVENQERGIFFTKGVLDPKCYGPGWHTYEPFTTNMDIVDVSAKTISFKDLGSGTSDVQAINVDMAVTIAIDPGNCHKLFEPGQPGHGYVEKIVAPMAQDSLKRTTAQYTLDKIISERGKVGDAVEAHLREKLAAYSIMVKEVNLVNVDPSKTFMEAVEQKQRAQQRAQQAEYERQQAEKEAEAAIAKARGQAKSNQLLAESLRQSPETIRFRELEVLEKKWNGNPPQIIFSDKAAVIPNLVR